MQSHTSLSLNDPGADELYQRHAYTLLNFIRRYAASPEDAEDVLLEVFIAAFEFDTLTQLSDGEQLAWLRRVARNKCIDVHRRAQRRQAVALESVASLLYEDEERAPEQLALRSEELALLRYHLAHLPRQQQTVVHLRFTAGLRCTEIASILNKSEGAVRMLLSRALNMLRKTYGQQGGNEDE